MKHYISILLLVVTGFSYAQNIYSVDNIPTNLKEGVDAVIREQTTQIVLKDFNDAVITEKEVITAFNRNGLNSIRPAADFDKSSSIKSIDATLYNFQGKVIKKFKKRDFVEVSASGSNLYTDNRMLVLDFTPPAYPFTFEMNVETRRSSTAFLPRWDPSPVYEVSTERSKYEIINEKQIPLTTRKFNLENFNVEVVEDQTKYSYSLKNLPAVEREPLSPHYTEFTPVVKVALQKFQLENKSAYVKTWKEFGLWQNNSLLKGRDALPEQTKSKVAQLVAGIDDPKEKARIIYKYMQDKTRYISVQVGIGGWQPSMAEEVDRLNYGDCKGLTNYTKALLKTQGIESYYTIVSAGSNARDLDEDFVALQGNHVILSVPFEDEMVFLECTSQQLPFNYLGTHTDDRKVLMVTPEGGVMTKTHTYNSETNLTIISATAVFDDDLKLSGTIKGSSSGISYNNKYFLVTEKKEDVVRYYKDMWGHLNSLKVSNVTFDNDTKNVTFKESLNFETEGYISKAGKRILINPNVFNRQSFVPDNDGDRTLPLEIRRGYSQKDEIEIILPAGYVLESIFDPIVIENEFGLYKASVTKGDGHKLVYQRELIIKSGRHPKEKFADYVTFRKNIVKKDKSKMVLIQE
ncbi:MAG: DUF3857 domain-containing protein [Bacteroidota bacterium]